MAQTQNARQPPGYMIAESREQKRRERVISISWYLWATGRHVILRGVRAPMPLKTYRVEGLIRAKSVEALSPPVGLQWKFRHRVPAQVSSLLLDQGSKLRGPSPLALELLYNDIR
ncbi:hypothetical protein TNCV_967631 [Trichonephila clavipes]|nr:hypothetical protein TNCV_967631 [Trichonephila clavipes]